MGKRNLANFLKRKFNISLPEARIKSAWGKEQIKKIGSLGQSLIVMQVG